MHTLVAPPKRDQDMIRYLGQEFAKRIFHCHWKKLPKPEKYLQFHYWKGAEKNGVVCSILSETGEFYQVRKGTVYQVYFSLVEALKDAVNFLYYV